MDIYCRYLMHTLDTFVEQDYSLVYFHYGLTSKNKPSLSWLWQAYKAFDRKYKKNLKALYLVHPTNFIRFVWQIFKPAIRYAIFFLSHVKNFKLLYTIYEQTNFCSVKFGRKIMYVNYLEDLAHYIKLDQLIIPPQVIEYVI